MAAVVAPIVSTFVPKGVIDAEKAFSKLGKELKAAVGTAAIIGFGKAAISAAEDAQKSAARIANIAKQAGYAGAELTKVTGRLADYADATARATGIDDDQIAAIQAKLLSFRSLAATAGKLGDTFDRATKASLDLAAAGFGPAEETALLLAKALEDPEKGIGRLERKIGPLTKAQRENIDALVEQNDLYGAQQAILAAVEGRVGGTAEATATATGKLSVTFDQLAESVGTAILPAFSALVTAFGKVVDLFTQLPAGLQTFIVAGLGLVVVLKKVRTALIALKVEASTANVVIAALAVAAEVMFAIFADQSEEGKAGIASMATEMAGMTDETLLAVDAGQQLMASLSDLSRRDYFKELVKSSPEVARRLLDLYIKTGKPKDAIQDLALALYDYETAAGIAAATTGQYGDAAYKAQTPTKGLWSRLKDLTAAVKDQQRAFEDALNAKLSYFDKDLALNQANRDLNDSLKTYDELIQSIADGTYDGVDANRDQQQAVDDVRQSALDGAKAFADLSIAQGSTKTAADLQVEYLSYVASSLAPDSPLRKELNQYIASLKLIPTAIDTKIRADITAALNGKTWSKFGLDVITEKRAAGGPVTGGMPYLVGEVGPELFVPKDSGTIIPNSRLATSGRGASSGAVYNINVNGAIDPAGTARTITRVLQDNGKRINTPVPVPS